MKTTLGQIIGLFIEILAGALAFTGEAASKHEIRVSETQFRLIELALFPQESWRENIRLSPKSMDIAVESRYSK